MFLLTFNNFYCSAPTFSKFLREFVIGPLQMMVVDFASVI